ncbi:MAG: hypothetical protein BWY76_02390 [bacterium ADurb.Bin429]|nr:MAG: hypothetical protein BWY76_02390 [bacterium ADurb.Bin429]
MSVKNPAGLSVPIAQAGEQGVVLGRLDLVFEKTEGWTLVESNGKLQPLTANVSEDPAMKTLLERWLAPIPTSAH